MRFGGGGGEGGEGGRGVEEVEGGGRYNSNLAAFVCASDTVPPRVVVFLLPTAQTPAKQMGALIMISLPLSVLLDAI